MRLVKVEEISPIVRIANHHQVHLEEVWERSIPDLQLICILEGVFSYSESGRQFPALSAGDILFLEPNIQHRFSLAAGQEAGRMAGMHFEFIPQGRWALGDYRLAVHPDPVTHPEEANYLKSRFIQMASVYASYRPYRKELVDSMAREILLLLAAHWQDKVLWAVKPSQRMEAMLAHIRANLARPLSRQSLSKTFNLSAGYINQLFQSELGMTPSAVINRERLACAYQLMERDGLSVAESAVRVGFQDPYYFSRLFKKVYTIPPSRVVSRQRSRSTPA